MGAIEIDPWGGGGRWAIKTEPTGDPEPRQQEDGQIPSNGGFVASVVDDYQEKRMCAGPPVDKVKYTKRQVSREKGTFERDTLRHMQREVQVRSSMMMFS